MGLNDFRYKILENNNTYTIFDSYNDEHVRDGLNDLKFAKGICNELNMDYYFNFNQNTNDDTERLFHEVKPYLDKGWSLNKTIQAIQNRTITDTTKRWYKDLKSYCKGMGYSDKQLGKNGAKFKDAFYHVQQQPMRTAIQGFLWVYRFTKRSQRYQTTSVDLVGLKRKVLERGWKWDVIDEVQAKALCKRFDYDFEELK